MQDSTEDKLELLIKTKLMKKHHMIDFSEFNKFPFRLKNIVFCENIYVRYWGVDFKTEEIRRIVNHECFDNIRLTDNGVCITMRYHYEDENGDTLIEQEYKNIHDKVMGYIKSLDIE